MPRLLRRLRRSRKRVAPKGSPLRGLGEPSTPISGAEDAELDALRGELVRELDRLAAEAGDSASFRRG